MAFDEAGFRSLLRGRTRGVAPSAARAALAVLSLPYAAAVRLRNLAFDLGLKRIHRASVPVVAVGNLTVGGTGKTPVVEYVCRQLLARGMRPCILSRGYRGEGGLNDEARLLMENLPDVPHLQGRDRVANADRAVREFGADALVLDDGFQHRRLHRDLNILLVDATDPWGGGRLLPRGLLREPTSEAKRADLVVLTRADSVDAEVRKAVWATVPNLNQDEVEVGFPPSGWRSLSGEVRPLESLARLRVAAFCGIGNPEAFRATLASVGAAPVGFRSFPDHHRYSQEESRELSTWARSVGADALVATQKDAVKLEASAFDLPLWSLRIEAKILSGGNAMETALARVVQRRS